MAKVGKALRQVAALPVMLDVSHSPLVLLVTSRETKRLIVPKGWPIKGLKDHEAAAIEARQEAGLIGNIHRKPIGSYSYWKRRAERSDFVSVDVFVLEVTRQLEDWKEKAERESTWLSLDVAADLIDEPALAEIIRGLKMVSATLGELATITL